ncbi:MAG: hypothetical protein ACK5OX_08060 [Desertimonas sp.]
MTDQSSTDRPSDQASEGGSNPEGPGAEQLDGRVADATAAMDDVRRQIAEAPAEVVVVNHVMGLYELAAIHLSAPQPDLAGAALAIDAVACLVEGLGDRLGPEAPTMRDALNNIRLAFVQIKGRAEGGPAASTSTAEPPTG